MELKARKDMDKEFLWDLSPIFADKQAWENAFRECESSPDRLAAVAGTLGQSAQSLKNGLDVYYTEMEKFERVYVYAMLSKASDGSDSDYQEMSARSGALYAKVAAASSFLTPELLSIDPDKLAGYRSTGLLDGYSHILDDIIRKRAHVLDAEREKMLAMLADASMTPSDTYDVFCDVDMELPEITDEKGETQRLTPANFTVLRESRSRRVREQAFEGMFGTYKKYVNTIASLYSGSVKLDCYYSSVRGFESARAAALDSDNAPLSVYDSLIEAVHSYLPSMRKYLELRRRVMKLDKLDMYDLYVPIVDEVEYEMPYESAKELVLRAMAPLGEEYQELLKKAYSDKWIDVYENKGKQSGAFSSGVYGVHPYVKLNYANKLDDAFTLAHELGHSMHSYFSAREQDYANNEYAIMVAEVASTCNEVLLTKYLLSVETDKKRRAYILNHFLEGFRLTVFRQTLFAEFEKLSHEMYEQGTPLTPDNLTDAYGRLLELYYDGAEVPETIRYEWSYIPHFYNAFYVYKYATGFSAAVAIADKILSTGDPSDYLKFLSLGGSDYPIEELKVAGVDLSDPETVRSALRVFDSTISELEELLK